MPNSPQDFTPTAYCAHLVITPEDPRESGDPDTAPVYVQRTFTDTAPAIFVRTNLAADISGALYAITGNDGLFDVVRDTIMAGKLDAGNIAFDIGHGMFAVIYPAEPTSGINRFREGDAATDGVYSGSWVA